MGGVLEEEMLVASNLVRISIFFTGSDESVVDVDISRISAPQAPGQAGLSHFQIIIFGNLELYEEYSSHMASGVKDGIPSKLV